MHVHWIKMVNLKWIVIGQDGLDQAEAGLLRFFQHNEWEGLDIEKDFPYDDVNKMRMAYDKLPVKTKVKMAYGDHKLAMRFLAKFGIKP